ncbi:hypothetical protein [Limosilactobacillus sp.]|uniref:hypothetical protein n=1 Tax=Limosilactobacillus sp. TaxID=2773925 RepID=UPI00359F869C
MKNKLAYIELTMENVEYWNIPAKDIKRLTVDNLQQSLNLNSDGEIEKAYTCKTIIITFDYQAINKLKTFALDCNGRNLGLGDRLKRCRDITHVILYYEDDHSIDIEVPWNFRSDTTNLNMYATINKQDSFEGCDEEVVLISSDQDFLSNESYYMGVR